MVDELKTRKEERDRMPMDERRTVALEQIADELVRLRNELQRIGVEISKAATSFRSR